MSGRRVLLSGLGGELGSLVASMLEAEPWVAAIEGIDADPPRRRLQRTTYHRIPPHDHHRIVELVTRFNPHVLVHIAVWEPASRVPSNLANELTERVGTSVIGAAAECRALESVVVRSGIEIYGRGPTALTRPDEDAPLRPTSPWGHALASVEETAAEVGARIGVPVGALRMAPVLGPHVPAPLGRVLRMPAVPFNAISDPAFSLLHLEDAARAIATAARIGLSGPVNVTGGGGITVSQALRRGKRFPVPVLGPQWRIVRPVNWMLGAPIPDHVAELLQKGRLADNGRMMDKLGLTPKFTTSDVIDEVYAWPSIVHQPAKVQVA